MMYLEEFKKREEYYTEQIGYGKRKYFFCGVDEQIKLWSYVFKQGR